MQYRLWFILTILIIISSISGCVSNSGCVSDTARNYSQDDIAYFQEIALGFEDGNMPEVVYKYNINSIKIEVYGEPDSESLSCLNSVISDFNAISKCTKLSLVKDNNPNIGIYFAPKSEFSKYINCFNKNDDGCFITSLSIGTCELLRGDIAISTTIASPEFRCHLIREELTQSLGFGKDARVDSPYENSIFHHHGGPNTLSYSEIDKNLIRMLYNSDVPSCATKDEVENYFRGITKLRE